MKLSLREWREQQGWSRAFLAKRLNELYGITITADAINKMEKKSSYPRYDMGLALQEMAKNQIDFSKDGDS